MPIANANTINALAEISGPITKCRFYTAGFATLLGETAIAYGTPVVSSGTATATIGSTPISDTWDATGTVAAVRLLSSVDAVVIERSDAAAVSTTGGGGFVELSSLAAVSGGAYNITGGTLTQPTLMAGES